MKKTIIITISMLCMFGAVVIFAASRVSNQWQTPQHDEIDLSVSYPVEIAEKELI